MASKSGWLVAWPSDTRTITGFAPSQLAVIESTVALSASASSVPLPTSCLTTDGTNRAVGTAAVTSASSANHVSPMRSPSRPCAARNSAVARTASARVPRLSADDMLELSSITTIQHRAAVVRSPVGSWNDTRVESGASDVVGPAASVGESSSSKRMPPHTATGTRSSSGHRRRTGRSRRGDGGRIAPTFRRIMSSPRHGRLGGRRRTAVAVSGLSGRRRNDRRDEQGRGGRRGEHRCTRGSREVVDRAAAAGRVRCRGAFEDLVDGEAEVPQAGLAVAACRAAGDAFVHRLDDGAGERMEQVGSRSTEPRRCGRPPSPAGPARTARTATTSG